MGRVLSPVDSDKESTSNNNSNFEEDIGLRNDKFNTKIFKLNIVYKKKNSTK